MHWVKGVENILPRLSSYKSPVTVIREDNHGCKDCTNNSVMYHQRKGKKNLNHPALQVVRLRLGHIKDGYH